MVSLFGVITLSFFVFVFYKYKIHKQIYFTDLQKVDLQLQTWGLFVNITLQAQNPIDPNLNPYSPDLPDTHEHLLQGKRPVGTCYSTC